MADDIRRLLHETADAPTSTPDLDGIRARIRRRRTARRGVAGMAVVVLLAGGAALATDGSDDGTEVQIVDRPEVTTPTEPPEPQEGDGVDLGSIGALAPEDIAIQTEAGVELRDLGGELLHVLDGYELATGDRPDGLQSTVTSVLPLQAPDGSLHWFDPASGLTTDALAPLGGTPLWRGGRVFIDGERVTVFDGFDSSISATWSTADRWWLSSNHRVVTWESDDCSSQQQGCRTSFDSQTGAATSSNAYSVVAGCWAAAAGRGDHVDDHLAICDGGDLVHMMGGSTYQGVGGPESDEVGTAVATAAWVTEDEVVVRAEQDTCFVAEAMVLRDAVLEPLLGADESGNPSSAWPPTAGRSSTSTPPRARRQPHPRTSASTSSMSTPGSAPWCGRVASCPTTCGPGAPCRWPPSSPRRRLNPCRPHPVLRWGPWSRWPRSSSVAT
ncbi:MAG: hypothetical protein JJE52_18090 [Acidimicrobiia bacterium]|nr:hypothetical protein [Acidimicrobiia bacterium]